MKVSIKIFILGLLFTLIRSLAFGSHLSGGQMAYQLIGISGDTSIYQVTLTIYEDYQIGNPIAIAQDNPAILGVYDGNSQLVSFDTNIHFSSSVNMHDSMVSACGGLTQGLYLLCKTFVATYRLVNNTSGYLVCYQRCCRDAMISNISSPGSGDVIYYCRIPPAINNSSAVFSVNHPTVVCLWQPLNILLSATDADGDSLSYALVAAYSSPDGGALQLLPTPPPYTNVSYQYPYSGIYPLIASPMIQIDPESGILTGTPGASGRYLISEVCYEWRAGIVIDTVYRDFDLLVAPCNAAADGGVAFDTVINLGDSALLHATVGQRIIWSPASLLSNDTLAEPVAHFPDTGNYHFLADVENDSGCISVDTFYVQVVPAGLKFKMLLPTAFCPGCKGNPENDIFKPIPVGYAVEKNLKVFNRYGTILYNGNGGWDGTYHGTPQDIGDYIWELTYETAGSKTEHEHGTVTLIR